jgi:hypothetical protein
MNIEAITTSLNNNGGVIAVVLFGLTVLWGLGIWAKRKYFPTKEARWEESTESISHASKLYNEFRQNTEWDDSKDTKGTFLIYDIKEGLPKREELSGPKPKKGHKHYSITSLVHIDPDFVEFHLDGCCGSTFIKRIADSWCESTRADEESIEAHLIGRLEYANIVSLRWDINDFWEWPQVCCKYLEPRRIPFLRKYYAEKKDNHLGESFYSHICEKNELERPPIQMA